MNKPYLSLVLFALALFSGAPASAQAGAAPARTLPGSLGETLKNIAPASLACRKDDVVDQPKAIASRQPGKPDLGCAITLDQLSPSLGKPNTILIDTRAKSSFDAGHIEGALNFNGAELRGKRYLADKPLVLLGDGKRDLDLYELCADLKAAGYRHTRVLRGGMLAWRLDDKPVAGAAQDFANASSVTPGELFQRSKMADSVIVGLSRVGHLADVLPTMQSVAGDDAAAVRAFLQKRKKGQALNTIVVVADEHFERGEIGRLAALAKPEPLLLYTGSEDAYRQFLRMQNALWSKQAKGPVKPRCGG